MKYFTVIFFITFLALSSYGQHTNDQDKKTKGIEIFHLGDSIQKFKNLLSCADAGSPKTIINLDSAFSCRTFLFLPAVTDSVQVGLVNFPNTFLFLNGQKKIKTVMYYKNYSESDSTNPKKLSGDDYDHLIAFTNLYLNLKDQQYNTDWRNNKNYKQEGRVWEKNKMKFILVKIEAKNKKIKFKYMLQFSYETVE